MDLKTLEQAANELGLKEVTLLNEHKKGKLPITVIGKQRYVEDADITAWIASKKIAKPTRRKMSADHLANIRAAAAARKARK